MGQEARAGPSIPPQPGSPQNPAGCEDKPHFCRVFVPSGARLLLPPPGHEAGGAAGRAEARPCPTGGVCSRVWQPWGPNPGEGAAASLPWGARRLPLVPRNLLVPAGYSGAFLKGRAEKQTEILPGLLAGPERLWLDVRRLLAAMFCSAGALGRRRKGNGADTVPVEDSEGFTQGRGS